MLVKATEKDFDIIFDIMQKSFSDDEYRTYSEQKKLLENPIYRIYVIKDESNDMIKAFIAIYEFDSILFVEHFAVNHLYRNQGIGSTILNELFNITDKKVCLEVELPENDNSIRRINFYERNNFHLNEYTYTQPSISKGKNSVPLLIMTSKRKVSIEEFENIKAILYSNVYKCDLT